MRFLLTSALSATVLLASLGVASADAPTMIINYKEGGAKGILQFLETGQNGNSLLFAFAPASTKVSMDHPEFQLDKLRIINIQTEDPVILYATKESPWNDLSDMVAAIQEEPGKYVFGSPGPSSAGTVMATQFIDALGLDVKVSPYQGGGKTRTAMLNGEVDFSAAGAAAPLNQIDEFKALAPFGTGQSSHGAHLP